MVIKKVLIVVLIAVLSFTAWWLWYSTKRYEHISTVVSAPPAKAHFRLDFYPHIATVERPSDSFPFPIAVGGFGPATSLYSGPSQYPFYCMTMDSGLGQPTVDNQQQYGVPVYDAGKLKGYSKDCMIPTRVNYFVIDQHNKVKAVPATTTPLQHSTLLRVEQGTINRFIYTIVMPIAAAEMGNRLAKSQWNQRLIYQFNGGSGIGYRQGRQRAARVIERQLEQLKLGYAVISSSGNKTSYTYNMLLAEDTARRVKKQFTSLYGEPLYTVGVGGSGGGLAQYLIAQNSEGILDGLIPLYSYPDMITQTTYALDCDLLNNYFTFRADDKKAWRDWQRRRHIEGMNALNDFPQKGGFLQPLNQLMAGFVPSFPDGSSECINSYFGLSAFINNPRQGFLRPLFSEQLNATIHWSYWQDMQHILGTDEQGMGLSTWDNVGVQYGLEALKTGAISLAEFIDINQKVGGWKTQSAMQQEQIALPFGHKIPIWLTLWGNHKITSPNQNGIAPRHQGNLEAMHNAYRSGQVFIGRVDLPIIDARHYLENELDMHHMSASFYSRLCIQQANGHAKNQLIWVADKAFNPTALAFKEMDKWLLTIKNNPGIDVVNAKPATLTDMCFDADGDIIAQGNNVFNGIWNNQPSGTCTQQYPMYSTSRIQAGGKWHGDTFKCHLVSVAEAVALGLYDKVDIAAAIPKLQQIFPMGVCDYRQPDVGRPADL